MSRILLCLLALSLLGLSPAAPAKPWWLRGVETNDSDFLPPDVAFRVGARVDGHIVKVRFVIADGYYLYRHKIAVAAESPDLLVAGIVLPHGVMKTDRYLGSQEIFTQQVEGSVPFKRFDYGAHPLEIKVTFQGCAEAGLCYPPMTRVLHPELGASDAPADGSSSLEASSTLPAWEGMAIIGGFLAFFFAGLTLRKGRRLEPPPP